ncbi:hypothetical protein BDD12DRAFT_858315, partial [Trichophaea hybrida]
MPSEVERVFSSSKILISDRRNTLGDSAIQAVECLKSWGDLLKRRRSVRFRNYLRRSRLQHMLQVS